MTRREFFRRMAGAGTALLAPGAAVEATPEPITFDRVAELIEQQYERIESVSKMIASNLHVKIAPPVHHVPIDIIWSDGEQSPVRGADNPGGMTDADPETDPARADSP